MGWFREHCAGKMAVTARCHSRAQGLSLLSASHTVRGRDAHGHPEQLFHIVKKKSVGFFQALWIMATAAHLGAAIHLL